MQLGIVGLGRMGGNIARRLMRAGHRTVVHDRNRDAIVGLEGEVIMMQDIFVFKKMGLDQEGNVVGRMLATGIRPRCLDMLIASGITMDPSIFAANGAGGRA